MKVFCASENIVASIVPDSAQLAEQPCLTTYVTKSFDGL